MRIVLYNKVQSFLALSNIIHRKDVQLSLNSKNMKTLYVKYKEVILYLFFGVMTTVINVLTFQGCRLLNFDLLFSNLIAWILSVLAAFVTNKLYVFESKSASFSQLLKETFLFFAARVLSLGVDMASITFMVNFLQINELISKIVSNVIVVIVNYVLSKFIIFKK